MIGPVRKGAPGVGGYAWGSCGALGCWRPAQGEEEGIYALMYFAMLCAAMRPEAIERPEQEPPQS